MADENETVTITFMVTATVNIPAYAAEYGEELDRAVTAGPEYAHEMVREAFSEDGLPNHKHWVQYTVAEPVSEPVRGEHGDGLAPGFRNPYDSEAGLFKGLCKCGLVFWAGAPDEADSLMLSHVEEMANCHHARIGEGEGREALYCDNCDARMVWTGPGLADFAPADA